jgi:hypothetical protein
LGGCDGDRGHDPVHGQAEAAVGVDHGFRRRCFELAVAGVVAQDDRGSEVAHRWRLVGELLRGLLQASQPVEQPAPIEIGEVALDA